MKRSFLRDNGLSLACAALFLVFLVGHSIAGYHEYNEEQRSHGEPRATYGAYLTSGDFGESVFENWESEFFQMWAYVMLTAFLFQRGSSESKDPDKKAPVDEDVDEHEHYPDLPAAARRRGLALTLYKHSLSLAFLVLFLASFAGHAVTGLADYNEEQREHGEPTTTLAGYLAGSRFWFESFQNWQSEFLAVLAIVVLSIRLREFGSPESKPIWRGHHETGSE